MIRALSRAKLRIALLATATGLVAAGAGPVHALVELGSVSAIVAGYMHACALSPTGGVSCWGGNTYGQLGDGSLTSRYTAVPVIGLSSGVVGIVAGHDHTCALLAGGAVKCWGSNGGGQLGDSSFIDRSSPVDVVGLGTGVASIAAGGNFTCAVTAGGGVKCWGLNIWGQLGNGTGNLSATPVNTTGLASGVSAISAGGSHACALTNAGGVKCWGMNTAGQLGDGSVTNRYTPVDVSGLASGVSAIAAGGSAIAANGAHTCALTSGGGVKCWGMNGNGQLGDGSITIRHTPVDVAGLAGGVAGIASGLTHTCARTAAGAMKCWGLNTAGQLGDGSTALRMTPADVSGLASGVTAIAAGSDFSCAITTGGRAKCWGDVIAVGGGSTYLTGGPGSVVGLAVPVSRVTAGSNHTCALTTAGAVKCWGDNAVGQVGDGTFRDRPVPADVFGLGSGVTAIASGLHHSCALTAGGGVKCWGYNAWGQLGIGSFADRGVPVDVPGLGSGVIAIAAGYYHTCAVTAGGAVKCWGRNDRGQVGDGVAISDVGSEANRRSLPTDVAGLGSGVASVSGGVLHSCAVTTNGAVKCWGDNLYGQLGDGSYVPRSTPRDVVGLTAGISATTGGLIFSCALTTGGGVKCWGGASWSGVLGLGYGVVSNSPVDFPGLGSGVSVVTAREATACALAAGGVVKCWGRDPLAVVPGLATGTFMASGKIHHDCIVTNSGDVSCWGGNAQGERGDGTVPFLPIPAPVLVASLPASPEPIVSSGANPSVAGQLVTFLASFFETPAPIGTVSFRSDGVAIAGCASVPVTMGRASCATAALASGSRLITADYGGDATWQAGTSAAIAQEVIGGAGDADGDGISNDVEVVEGTNPLVKDNDVLGNARLFAMQQYRDFLGREGDPAGIAGWTGSLSTGTYERMHVIDAFLQSPEFAGFVAPVVRLYFATFLRIPDYAGLTFNAGLVRNGTVTPRQLADFFTASPEFAALYGSLDNTQFVTLLYDNVLGRTPDVAGLAGWVGLLDGGMPRGQVLIGFSDSPEYEAAMANEVLVTMMYVGMLRRSPEPAGFAAWTGFLDSLTYPREQVINGFLLSSEYRARFLP